MKGQVLAALKLNVPYVARTQPQNLTQSAVLLLLDLIDKTSPQDIRILLTQRSETVDTHKGHFAFPGGICEPLELEQKNGKILTALRELEEEVGVSDFDVEVLGSLPELATLSGFQIFPVVAAIQKPASEIRLVVQDAEVSQVFWCSLSTLSQTKKLETYTLKSGISAVLPVFYLEQGRVWGATAILLDNLLQRIHL